MPLVSVIAAIYNVERYVEDCIKSIAGQTFGDMEILLIDDGSQDAGGAICDRYAREDGRIRVIHKENGGIADVRNLGLKEAKGTYLMYVDGDDFLAPDCVEHAVAGAKKYEADLVVFDFTEIEESTGRQDRWSMQVPRDRVINVNTNPELLVASPSPCNKLYRKAFWEKTGLRYPSGRNYEDLTLTPQLMLKAEKVVYLDSDPLYYYVLHDGSIMRSKNFAKSYRERTAWRISCGIFKNRGRMPDSGESWSTWHLSRYFSYQPRKCCITSRGILIWSVSASTCSGISRRQTRTIM